MTKAIVFDIEGTIGDIAFVRNVLFPYARERLRTFLDANWDLGEVQPVLQGAREASARSLQTPAEAETLFAEWIDADRKITPLKTLQGLIWREGYASGALKAHLYDDAIHAMKSYAASGMRLFIYSSGSIEAQKLYMENSVAGDLTGMLENYFDTTTGPKGDPASYSTIARSIGLAPGEVVFFSDAPAEVNAAHAAGFIAICINRSQTTQATGVDPVIRTIAGFSEVNTSAVGQA